MQKTVNDINEKVFKQNAISPLARLADITSELGELSKEVLKATNYGTGNFKPNKQFILEFGDVLYALLSFANECDIDANTALNQALNKYKNRFIKNKNITSNN